MRTRSVVPPPVLKALTRPLLRYGPGQFFREHSALNDRATTGFPYDTISTPETATMDTLPDPTMLTGRELTDEWRSISADAENREERSAALAAKLNKLHIEF